MSRVATFSAIAATAVLGYCAYFDYKRRTDKEFRKSLKKRELRAEKKAKEQALEEKKKILVELQLKYKESEASDPIPRDPAGLQEYFLKVVSEAEKLAAVPGMEVDSAILFYKALKAYPNPNDILAVYEKTVPPHILELVLVLAAVEQGAAAAAAAAQTNID
ncbi:unnamed protein product [Kuraishia capsulata CBS 1993]|uniref:Mitochondrial import receptor subunit TOM20 n=1 Tax=Kuraishia capsulata CBS 1993 TaxID=1382522 RepID=W6MNK1_9ASCO|nr:uncharacterized protein KUCA_T00002595001 [Kuraishia capsulata CBS 1993]CDK26622.1 unnamed protein product [Kuraishia capsulata CBS 1993]